MSCLDVYICMYIQIHMHKYTETYLCTYAYVLIYIDVYVYICTNLCVWIFGNHLSIWDEYVIHNAFLSLKLYRILYLYFWVLESHLAIFKGSPCVAEDCSMLGKKHWDLMCPLKCASSSQVFYFMYISFLKHFFFFLVCLWIIL